MDKLGKAAKETAELKAFFEDKIAALEADFKNQIFEATSIKKTGAKNALYDGIKNMIKKKVNQAN